MLLDKIFAARDPTWFQASEWYWKCAMWVCSHDFTNSVAEKRQKHHLFEETNRQKEVLALNAGMPIAYLLNNIPNFCFKPFSTSVHKPATISFQLAMQTIPCSSPPRHEYDLIAMLATLSAPAHDLGLLSALESMSESHLAPVHSRAHTAPGT